MSIGRLIDNNVLEPLIIQHSGQRRVESLSSYKSPSFSCQRQVFHYLSRSAQSQKKPAAPQTSPACVQSTPTSGFRPVQYHVALHPQTSVTDPSTESSSTNEMSSVTKSQMSFAMPAMFGGASITNCVFQIFPNVVSMDKPTNHSTSSNVALPSIQRKRRYIIDSDSDIQE